MSEQRPAPGNGGPRPWRRTLLRRLVLLVPVALGVVTLVFLLLHLIPGDPVDAMLGEQAAPADREALRRALGLDRPVVPIPAQNLVLGLGAVHCLTQQEPRLSRPAPISG